MNKLPRLCLNLGFTNSVSKNVSTAILCCMLLTGFNESVHASETSTEFIFNCSKQGEVVIPNIGGSFSRFDPNNSDLDRVEYTPSFSKTGILLRSDREDFFINLKSGNLLFRTEVVEKCDILQRPAEYKLSSDEFMFFCAEQGGLVIPNTGESFFSDWDGVEYTPSFSKTGIFLKSERDDLFIDLKNGDQLFLTEVVEKCDILQRPADYKLSSDKFMFFCADQGGLVIPNTGESFFSDWDGVEYTPSFSKTGIFLKSERDDFFIDLKSGDLLYHTDVFEKCDILQRPTDYKLSSNKFMFFCAEQGGLVIPNTGESFFSNYDGVEYTPSFSKTGIFLKSEVGDYVINLQSGDLLYGDDLNGDDVLDNCKILGRAEQDGGLNLKPTQNAESQATETGKLQKPLVGSVDTKDENISIKDLIERDGLFYEKSSEIPFTGMVSGLEIGNFVNGLKEGEWVEYHQNGNVSKVANYINGKTEGYYVRWHENGQLRLDMYHKNGMAHGLYVYYNEDGRVIISGEWKQNQQVGHWIKLNEDLNEWTHGEFEFDSPRYTETTFYPSGQIQDRYEYLLDGNEDGSFEAYYENGQIKFEGEHENAVLVGQFRKYFQDGTIDEETSGFYENGIKVRGLSTAVTYEEWFAENELCETKYNLSWSDLYSVTVTSENPYLHQLLASALSNYPEEISNVLMSIARNCENKAAVNNFVGTMESYSSDVQNSICPSVILLDSFINPDGYIIYFDAPIFAHLEKQDPNWVAPKLTACKSDGSFDDMGVTFGDVMEYRNFLSEFATNIHMQLMNANIMPNELRSLYGHP